MPCGGLCAAGGAGKPSRGGGGVAFHRCEGHLVSGAVPPPAAPPLGRAARVPRPVFPGRGCCGRADPAPAAQRVLLRAVVTHCGGGGRAFSGASAPRHCKAEPGVRRSPSPGRLSVGRAARARRSLAVGVGAWAWVCRPSVGRAAGLGCVWCVWCLYRVCVLVGAWRCAVCLGAVVRGAASLRSSPWCPPLLRYLVVVYLPWLGAVPPSPRASIVGLLATLLLPSALRRSLLFPPPFIGLPSSLARIFPCLTCVLVCVSVFFLACFPVFWAQEKNLRRVPEVLDRHKTVRKPTMASLFPKEVAFGGHVIGRGQRKPMPSNLAALTHWERPNTVSELRSFMALCNYSSGYVRMYAELSGPLHKTLQVEKFNEGMGSKEKLAGTTEAQEAFETLKRTLLGKLGLFLINLDKGSVLSTDASAYATGAVLEQVRADGFHFPAAFSSRVLAQGQLALGSQEKRRRRP